MKRKLIAAIAAIAILLTGLISISGCAPQGGVSRKQAEAAVLEYMRAQKPDLNPDVSFKLKDVTPKDVRKDTPFQVFRDVSATGTGDTFIFRDGAIVHSVTGFGGFGLVSVMSAKFTEDDTALVYTYSWGSGLHHCVLEVYDAVYGAHTVIVDTTGQDMVLKREANNAFNIYAAEMSGDSPANWKAEKGDMIATLIGQGMEGGGYQLRYTTLDRNYSTVDVNEKTAGENAAGADAQP